MVYVHAKPICKPGDAGYWVECGFYTGMCLVLGIMLLYFGLVDWQGPLILFGLACIGLAGFMVWAWKHDEDAAFGKNKKLVTAGPQLGALSKKEKQMSLNEFLQEIEKSSAKKNASTRKMQGRLMKKQEEVYVVEDVGGEREKVDAAKESSELIE